MSEADFQEYILERGIREVGYYFSNIVKEQRRVNKVAVRYTDINESLMFVPCDSMGIPKIRTFEFLTIMGWPNLTSLNEGDISTMTTQVYKKVIFINQPEICYRANTNLDFFSSTYYFMWSGVIEDKREIPIEQLDVKYLMQLAQSAIEKREPIILDEVTKNKLIK